MHWFMPLASRMLPGEGIEKLLINHFPGNIYQLVQGLVSDANINYGMDMPLFIPGRLIKARLLDLE